MRLIWFIRGFDKIIELGFQSNAFYSFNGTDDYFVIGRIWSKKEAYLLSPLFVIGKYLRIPSYIIKRTYYLSHM